MHSLITAGALEKSCMLSIKYEGNAASVHVQAGRSWPSAERPPRLNSLNSLSYLSSNFSILHQVVRYSSYTVYSAFVEKEQAT